MEMTQYQKDLIRMWDSLRTDDKGSDKCVTVRCDKCPLCDSVCEAGFLFNTEKAIEVVTQWAKEHPVITYADKYKEVFGVEPKKNNGDYVCPHSIGFINVACYQKQCEDCMEGFWESEYKPPKKEGE